MTLKATFESTCDLCGSIDARNTRSLPDGWRIVWLNFGHEPGKRWASTEFVVCEGHENEKRLFKMIWERIYVRKKP